jgi:hypothetical protein
MIAIDMPDGHLLRLFLLFLQTQRKETACLIIFGRALPVGGSLYFIAMHGVDKNR